MSALADRSYETMYRLKRARIMARSANIARYQNQENGTIIPPQVGPGGSGMADSDRLSISLGRRRIWREVNPAPCTGTLPNNLATGGNYAGLTYSDNPPAENPLTDGCCPVVT